MARVSTQRMEAAVGAIEVFSGIGDATLDAAKGVARASAQAGARVARTREAFTPPVASDPDADLTATAGGSPFFNKISDGRSRRDLPRITQERSIELAYHLVDSNPVAKRGLELIRDFVLGDGVTVRADAEEDAPDDAIQAAIDRFWLDQINLIDIKLPKKVFELSLFGEQCWPVFVNPISGHVRLGTLDPSAIERVLKDPGNAEKTVAIVGKPIKTGGPRRYWRVIAVDENPLSPTFDMRVGIPADDVEALVFDPLDGKEHPAQGSCFWFTINDTSTATRGRSDLLTVVDWIDAHDQILFTTVDRAMLMLAFVWDVEVQGADDKALEAYLAKNPAPKPGSVRAHNEEVTWSAVAPDLRAYETGKESDLLLAFIATGLGLPKTWLNSLDDVNRATAAEVGEPAFRRLVSRQRFVRYMIREVINFVLDQAKIAGTLTAERPDSGWAFAVDMPELRTKDMQSAATTLFQSLQGITLAINEGVLDRQTAQEATALLLGQIGLEVDTKVMKKRIEAEQAEADEEMADGLATALSVNGLANGQEDQDEGGLFLR